MTRAAQLLKDLATAKLIMETEPRGRAENRRADAARLAQETGGSIQPTLPSEPIPPSASTAIAKPTFYKRAPAWALVSEKAKHLVEDMMELDPMKRLTAEAALKHPWFQDS